MNTIDMDPASDEVKIFKGETLILDSLKDTQEYVLMGIHSDGRSRPGKCLRIFIRGWRRLS